MICVFLIISCNPEDEINFDLINTVKYKNMTIDCIVVAPSGDMIEVRDATILKIVLSTVVKQS